MSLPWRQESRSREGGPDSGWSCKQTAKLCLQRRTSAIKSASLLENKMACRLVTTVAEGCLWWPRLTKTSEMSISETAIRAARVCGAYCPKGLTYVIIIRWLQLGGGGSIQSMATAVSRVEVLADGETT